MKNLLLLTGLVFLCTSCSHFSTPHYRHVRKVDAHYVPVEVHSSTALQTTSSKHSDTVCNGQLIAIATSDSSARNNIDLGPKDQKVKQEPVSARVNQQPQPETTKRQRFPLNNKELPNDWSLATSIVLVILGILLLFYAVGILLAAPFLLVLRWIFSALLASVAIKLIVRGVSMFVNHFRNPKLYKEKG